MLPTRLIPITLLLSLALALPHHSDPELDTDWEAAPFASSAPSTRWHQTTSTSTTTTPVWTTAWSEPTAPASTPGIWTEAQAYEAAIAHLNEADDSANPTVKRLGVERTPSFVASLNSPAPSPSTSSTVPPPDELFASGLFTNGSPLFPIGVIIFIALGLVTALLLIALIRCYARRSSAHSRAALNEKLTQLTPRKGSEIMFPPAAELRGRTRSGRSSDSGRTYESDDWELGFAEKRELERVEPRRVERRQGSWTSPPYETTTPSHRRSVPISTAPPPHTPYHYAQPPYLHPLAHSRPPSRAASIAGSQLWSHLPPPPPPPRAAMMQPGGESVAFEEFESDRSRRSASGRSAIPRYVNSRERGRG